MTESVPAQCVPASQSPQRFDLNLAGNELRFDVRKYSAVNIQAVVVGTVWTTAVLTVYRSLDGATPAALETPQTLGPGSAMTNTIVTTAFGTLIVRLTTVEGGEAYASIAAMGSDGTVALIT